MKETAMRRPTALSISAGSWILALALLPGCGGSRAEDEPKAQARPANRLARETSPYLLLHAHNPVDWYPWGPEALAKAKAEGKPIFLSVGYSSCYWCHVMERESFMDEAIAKVLNESFVCIKVDREERPDVDQIYMTALQAFSGRGGWPMSLFLTPDGRPFFGGTYFPPRSRDGMPGFAELLDVVINAWRDHRPELEKDADGLTAIVRRSSALAAGRRAPLSRAMAAACRAQLAEQFDLEFGGFGFDPDQPRRPKFPEPVNLVFLLDQHRRAGVIRAGLGAGSAGRTPLEMVLATLDHMARGGVRDHLAGGYHRYSTDRSWAVPHFEKMLYDQAQLASVHLMAFEITGDQRWRREAEATFAFVARSLTGPEGAFDSALDAEAESQEGRSYVWTPDEVKQVLGDGDDFRVFAEVYGLTGPPNFEDDRYVLLRPRPLREQAEILKTTPEALETRLAPLGIKLLAARERRPAPLRDDKVLTSWNGLMIAAYADGFRILKDDRYRRAAETAADFLLTRLRAPDGRLLRTYRAGQAKLPAYLEDYAFLVHGLLRLHAATGDAKRLAQARELTDRMIADFADEEHGGFFYTADDHEALLARPKDLSDGALPGGNSIAIGNLVALAAATGDARYLDEAGRALDAFSAVLAQAPAGAPLMVVALDRYLDARPEAEAKAKAKADPQADTPRGPVVVTGEAALAPATKVIAGREFEVVLTLTIADPWHLYANPTGTANVKPTVVTLAPEGPAVLERVDYPRGEAKALAGLTEKIPVYEGRVTITTRVGVKPDAKPGPADLIFRVRYQACDDRACLAPATLSVPLPVDVKPATTGGQER
jgi:uncharacterized protein YyaL (SSP411 family)